MTTLQLLLWISGLVALQLVVYATIALVRLRRSVPPAPVAPTGYRRYTVVKRLAANEKGDAHSFWLKADEGNRLPEFLPGQFVTIQLQTAHDAQPLIRCYSLSDVPTHDTYRITVKRVAPVEGVSPAGRASNYLHDQIGVGSQLLVRPPGGQFHLLQAPDPVVLIAAGIGITPLLCMLKWCAQHQPEREVWLFYGVRDGSEIVVRQELEATVAAHTSMQLILCFSAPCPDDLTSTPSPGVRHHQGRIDTGLLRTLLPLRPYHFYLCGPSSLLANMVPALQTWGVPPERIHFESFGPSSLPEARTTGSAIAVSNDSATDTSLSCSVYFRRSNKRLTWTHHSGNLLDFAEANGITVDSGCRSGNCGSCSTAIAQGETRYLRPPQFKTDSGVCLLCISTPKTDLALEV